MLPYNSLISMNPLKLDFPIAKYENFEEVGEKMCSKVRDSNQ